MGDPNFEALDALQECVSSGKEWKESDDGFDFGNGKTFAKDTVTPFKNSGEDGKFYTLHSIVHLAENEKMKLSEFNRLARNKGISAVKFNDRQKLLNVLKGKEKLSKPSEDTVTSSSQQEEKDDESGERASKKAKHDDAQSAAAARATMSPTELLIRKLKKHEGSHRDRSSILMSSHRFVEVLRIEDESKRSKQEERKRQALQGTNVVAGGSGQTRDLARAAQRVGVPIIVVPAALSAPINLYNVKNFLEKGIYVHTSDARKLMPRKPEFVVVEKEIPGHGFIRFKVVDSVKKFQPQHWDRLAAVFTIGQMWQFKDWVWKDPAQVFDNCRGMHVYFDDHKLDQHIKDWNVETHPIKKQSRHHDSVAVHRIWDELDKFLKNRKPILLESGKIKQKKVN